MLKLSVILCLSLIVYTPSWAQLNAPALGIDERYEMVLLAHAVNSSSAPVSMLSLGSFDNLEACKDAASEAAVIGKAGSDVTFVCVKAGMAGEKR